MAGGKGKLNVEITAVPPGAPPPAEQPPFPKAGTVERRKFQAHADAEEEDQVVVHGGEGRIIFSGSPADFRALKKALKEE